MIAVAIGLAALVAPASTVAARPVSGGRYPLIQPEQSSSDLPDRSGVLQVSAGGRALTSMPAFGSCATAAGRTVLLTGESRVYKNKDLFAYGCVLAAGPSPSASARAASMARSSSSGSSGPYVSFVAKVNNEGGVEETLKVVDLRGTGRTLRVVSPSAVNSRENDFAATPLLSSRGASAWVADSCVDGGCTGPYEVWIADRAGPRRVDHGAGIDPESLAADPRLALHRGRVTWTDDGVGRAAAIAPGERGSIGGGRAR